MTVEDILAAAIEELAALGRPKLWMTERGLAKRLRKRDACKTLDHVRLRSILMAHAEQRPRKLRNSASPSVHTLEVLWGAIREGGVREADVPLPLLTGGPLQLDAVGRIEQAEFDEDAEPADYFLSYRMADELHARYVVRTVEHRAFSVWDAGSFIVRGEHINDSVLDAMKQVKRQLVYLSESALSSLWVGKEVIHGERLELEQTIVLKGDDDVLMDGVYRMLEGGPPQFPPYRDASSQAVEMYREILRAELTEGESTVFLHPVPIGDRWRKVERLKPVSEFSR